MDTFVADDGAWKQRVTKESTAKFKYPLITIFNRSTKKEFRPSTAASQDRKSNYR